ncbi:PTS ascorbate transporter subunit IIC [Oceanivirga salmonicida]|uniref:PTS ascorbate transporter subunit IIC n=1 Tax=Oceanivirga salmonicida TaxID=1769291 RepID=UPI0012E1582F|nr:PTS ascorbate transporter subunit IIC [Oceanivirga salmonicida]
MDFISSNILRNPPILMAIISMIGLAIQKKNFSDIIKGSLLAAFAMIIIDAGVKLLIGTIIPINDAFSSITGGAVGEGLNAVTFTSKFGGMIGLTMFIGLFTHLLIARFTPIKTIFLTGHMLWWFPFIFVAAGVEGGLDGVYLIVFASILSALYWSIMPWLLKSYVFKVTNDNSFTIGHPTGILSIIAGFIASKTGDTTKSTESLKFSSKLSFLREISITGSIVMMIIWLIIGGLIPILINENENLFMISLKSGITFGAGLIVLLYGVRMLINQIIPAFKGISEKIVPNALPAFDCPILFNYKPNAVLIGFIVAMILSTIMIIIVNISGIFKFLLLPLVITSFFECGCAAVIAEGQGGIRGCIIGTSVVAIIMVLFLAISIYVYSNTIQNWMLIFGGNDFSVFGVIAKYIAQLLKMVI